MAGVFLAYLLPLGWPLGIFLSFIGLSIILVHRERAVVPITLLIIFSGLGVLRYEQKAGESYAIIPSGKITTEAVIIDEPVSTDAGTRYTLRLATSTAMAVMTIAGPSAYQYGDSVVIRGNVVSTDEGKTPEYWRDYLLLHGIRYQISFPSVSFLEHGRGDKFFSALYWVKDKWLEKTNELMPEPESALLGGILIGARTTLGKEITEQFNKTGVSHIVALSGYNITMVVMIFGYVFSALPFTLGLSLSAIAIILFVLMTGLSASAVRAVIMALILLLAKKEGRTYDAGTALFAAAFLMSLYNPLTPLYDFSFQLSFLATSGIIWISPFMEKRLEKWPKYWKLKETIIGTISAMILVLPLVIYKTGIISLIALAANILTVPLVPYIMGFGAVAVALGFVSMSLAFPISAITYIMLYYVIHVVAFLASLPFAYITLAL